MTAPAPPEPNKTTAQRLIDAAMAEFNQGGYAATDSNKIARRAGFAPQTFYRWFKDKTEIFLAVYRQWSEQEISLLVSPVALTADQIVDVVVAHHRAYRIFRRSLRSLAVEHDAVRAARAENRQRQLAALQEGHAPSNTPKAASFVLMLQIERLADALADDEFADLGVDERAVRQMMVDLIAQGIGAHPA